MRLATRLVLFPTAGTAVGILLAVVAGLSYLASHGVALQRLGLSYLQLLRMYLLAGVAGSLVIAVLWPLHRGIVGAFVLGAAGLFPLYYGAGALLRVQPVGLRLGIAVLLAVLVGGTVATGAWLDEHGSSSAPKWVDTLRFPTRTTVASLWVSAAISSALAWYLGLKWAGDWPATLAISLFLVPVGLAVGVTLVALRRN